MSCELYVLNCTVLVYSPASPVRGFVSLAKGRERSPYQAKMRSTTAGLLLLISSANSLSLGLAPVRRSAVHRVVMQVSERQPH